MKHKLSKVSWYITSISLRVYLAPNIWILFVYHIVISSKTLDVFLSVIAIFFYWSLAEVWLCHTEQKTHEYHPTDPEAKQRFNLW